VLPLALLRRGWLHGHTSLSPASGVQNRSLKHLPSSSNAAANLDASCALPFWFFLTPERSCLVRRSHGKQGPSISTPHRPTASLRWLAYVLATLPFLASSGSICRQCATSETLNAHLPRQVPGCAHARTLDVTLGSRVSAGSTSRARKPTG
jgi:hypothetical protein